VKIYKIFKNVWGYFERVKTTFKSAAATFLPVLRMKEWCYITFYERVDESLRSHGDFGSSGSSVSNSHLKIKKFILEFSLHNCILLAYLPAFILACSILAYQFVYLHTSCLNNCMFAASNDF
jgi:hypothetical protein